MTNNLHWPFVGDTIVSFYKFPEHAHIVPTDHYVDKTIVLNALQL